MKVLIDISHPAHAHFFRHSIEALKKNNHQVLITSRDKDVAHAILDGCGLEYISLVKPASGGFLDFGRELIQRDIAMIKLVRKFKPDVLAAIGGTFIAHSGFVTRTPSLVFYDTESAKLQNKITYPFASHVIVPDCYYGKVPEKKCTRYSGYHELAYLHPKYFSPNYEVAVKNGLDLSRDNFLIRIVSWNANHDIGESHWNKQTISVLVKHLESLGNVIISSEAKLPEHLEKLVYAGDTDKLHHVLAFCRMYIGESATVASEAAVLGIPAIYASLSDRGYTTEQQTKYQLVDHVRSVDWHPLKNSIDHMLDTPKAQWDRRRKQLLNESIDVSQFIYDSIINKRPSPTTTVKK